MAALVRKDYKIREDQVKSLDSLPGNASEHVRAAIDDYIIKKAKENSTHGSLSPSGVRKDVYNG